MMRHTTYLLLFTFILIASCSKSNSDLMEVPNDPEYKISKMEFFQSATDEIDSVFTRLDTTIRFNNSNQYGTDITYEPYQYLLDSLSITTDDSSMQQMNIVEGMYLPSITTQYGVYYAQDDSLYLNSFHQNFTLSVGRRIQSSETINSPTPKTKYIMTGEYFQIRYSFSFKAELLNLTDSSYSSITGKVSGTRVTTSYYLDQPEQPTAFIIIAKNITEMTD